MQKLLRDKFLHVKHILARVQIMNDVQLRMARVALKLGVREMAELTGVSHFTIVRMEAGQSVKANTVAKVQAALEAAGIQFIPENGGGAGVRLRKINHNQDGTG